MSGFGRVGMVLGGFSFVLTPFFSFLEFGAGLVVVAMGPRKTKVEAQEGEVEVEVQIMKIIVGY
jgi:hypothetical protein